MLALEAALERVLEHPGARVLEGRAAAGTLGVARALGVPAASFGFEVRLAGRAHEVDFGIGVAGDPSSRLAFGESALRARRRGPRAWRRLADWARGWARQPGVVNGLFLELDAPSAATPYQPPSIFLKLQGLWHDGPASTGETVGRIRDALGDLLRAASSARLRTALGALLGRVETPFRFTYVGVMLSRPGSAVRLVGSVPVPRLRQLLVQAGMTQALERLPRVWPFLVERAWVEIQLELPVGDRQPLAIELVPAAAQGSAVLLDQLVSKGLCSAQYRRVIEGWRGRTKACAQGESWPLSLELVVGHFKLSQRTSSMQAKAYLMAQPVFSMGRPDAGVP